MKWFYVGIVTIGLVLLGQANAKVALTLAALVLLGAILFNQNNFKRLVDPAYKPRTVGGGGRSGGAGSSGSY